MDSPGKKDYILFKLAAPSENVSASQRHLHDMNRIHYLFSKNDAHSQDSSRAASSGTAEIELGDHFTESYGEPDWSPTSTAVDTSGDLNAEIWHLKLDESINDKGVSTQQTGHPGHIRAETQRSLAGTTILHPAVLDSIKQYQFGYLAPLTIIQPNRNEPEIDEEVRARLLVDTGSITSWLSGINYVNVTPDGRFGPWPKNESLRRGAISYHGLEGLNPATLIGKPFQMINYEDAVGFSKKSYKTKYTVQLPFYTAYPAPNKTWKNKRNESIIEGSSIAVAFALSRGTLLHNMDGTLALGPAPDHLQPSKFQIDGKSVASDPPTFSKAVQKIVNNGPDELTGGTSIYFCFVCQVNGQVLTTENSSFIAFNSWPGINDINLSSRIHVIKTSSWRDSWVIRLNYFVLQEYLPSKNLWEDRKVIAHIGTNGQQEPIEVLLDSGTSMSYLPTDMVEQIATLFKAESVTLSVPLTAPYYTVPPDFPIAHYRIKYFFEGIDVHIAGNSTPSVTVTGHIWPFTYIRYNDVREGLIGSMNNISPNSGFAVGIFGIKWFQTMIVGLFSGPEGDYVRLTGSTPTNHVLPIHLP